MAGSVFKREIRYYKSYYLDFFEKQKPAVKTRLNWTLQLISELDRVPEKYFKHLGQIKGLYEIRVEVGSDIFRIFSFFDKGHLIILLNAFQKKSQKTPAKEIEIALKLRQEYYYEKQKV